MFTRTIKTVAIIMVLCLPGTASGQEDDYRMELGASMGGAFYMGDANYTTPFKNTRPAGGAMVRFILNQRMAIKANLTAASIAGSTAGSKGSYPNGGEAKFRRSLIDLGAQYEYNFLAYGTGYGYNGGHRLTPYIAAGVGLTYALPAAGVLTMNIPLGVGLKYKIGRRLNAGCEVTMRLSMSDKLDATGHNSGLQLNDPYGIKSKGLKNKDSYAFAMVFVTYDLFAKCKECN